ncbi:MAG TPA: carboxypeptidase-like regulatory domain-containing protein [Pyrinomonadaceae bacterium]|nr:carboxypeptidase-like regulatory domain-containing protein [Pyrinomonadaceae bacterium]
MASIKRRLCFCLILIVPLVVLSATRLCGQTPEAKTKANGSISGRVTIGEKPAPGILIAVSGLNSPMPTAQATSDAEGNYRIGGLAAGQINVTPVAPVYVVPASAMFGQGRVVNLSANEAVEGIDFKLTRGGVITGRITDADGRPVIEERISLIAIDENGAPVRGPTLRQANFMMYQTDDRGAYRIYGLPAGHYKVSVGEDINRIAGMRASGYYQRVFYPDATEINKAGIVDVSEGGETKNIDIKLGRRSATYSASGRIIDADTGRPLAGVYFSVGAVQQNQNQSYVSGTSGPSNPTNSQGEFRMEGLSPGRYVLMINSQNFNPNATSMPKVYSEPLSFEIADVDVTNLEIKAQPGLTISGVVVPEGISDKTVLARISKLVVAANVNPGPMEIRAFTGGSAAKVNPDGSFLIEGLHPGKIMLNVGYGGPESIGFTTTRIEYNGVVPNREIELPPGQNISGVKIYVAYGTGVVRGQVKVEGGTLPTDAVIFISLNTQGEPNRFNGNGQVDSRGRFLIRGVSRGTYEVVLQIMSLGSQQLPRGFQRPQRQTVTVTDGSDTEVLFTLDLSRKDVP